MWPKVIAFILQIKNLNLYVKGLVNNIMDGMDTHLVKTKFTFDRFKGSKLYYSVCPILFVIVSIFRVKL